MPKPIVIILTPNIRTWLEDNAHRVFSFQAGQNIGVLEQDVNAPQGSPQEDFRITTVRPDAHTSLLGLNISRFEGLEHIPVGMRHLYRTLIRK